MTEVPVSAVLRFGKSGGATALKNDQLLSWRRDCSYSNE